MHTRPCWVEICTSAFAHNYRFLAAAAAPHAELLAIIKADAYGHSLAICAPAAIRAGAKWLGVTSVEEGVSARALCPDAHILAIGGAFPGQAREVVQHHLTAVAWEPWQFDELESAASAAGLAPSSLSIHLEIDTGMSRQGVDIASLRPLLARFTASSPLKLGGVMTHLFAADEANGIVTRDQLDRLAASLQQIRESGLKPEWLNVGNSAALLAGQAPIIADLAAQHQMKALLRPGLALYGLAPHYDPGFESAEPQILVEARRQLQPVLSWKSKVVTVRSIERAAAVGYNGTFVATEPMRIALVAAGYADGLDRRLGNRFSLLVQGQHAPLIGRISMDHSVVDVTEIPGVAAGDEVVLIGQQGSAAISAEDHASASGTIAWEIFTRIGARVLRNAV